MRKTNQGGILRSLRENPLRSLFFWDAVTAFVGASLLAASGPLIDRHYGPDLAVLSLPVLLVGAYCLLFAMATVRVAERRGWIAEIYLACALVFGGIGWQVGGLL